MMGWLPNAIGGVVSVAVVKFVAVALAFLSAGHVVIHHAAGVSAQPPAVAVTLDLTPLVERLKVEEGFRAHAYRDTERVLTIGYGTNLDQGITEPEGAYLLRARLEPKVDELTEAWPPFAQQPDRIKLMLLDMAYEMGVAGVLAFHDMLGHIAREDYAAAHRDADLSLWARQVPTREQNVTAVLLGDN